jgi:haloalkane dehalogenase
MQFVRTPDERFANLPNWPYEPKYVDVSGLRMHYVDEGARDAEPVLMLHGEPSWSYLYRKMIPIITGAGLRAIAPDLIGFGRSDKPTSQDDYTYQRHVDWTSEFVSKIDLTRATLVCQDWGGLIGLRVVAAYPERFSRVVAANTFLPTGEGRTSEAFLRWQNFSQTAPSLPIGPIVHNGSLQKLTPEEIAAYEAPFPDDTFKAGARKFPALVPTSPDDPASVPNRKAWEVLSAWEKPFLCAFGDSDPITAGADRAFQQRVPGTKGMPHVTLEGAGHFLQENVGEELARIVVEFVKQH